MLKIYRSIRLTQVLLFWIIIGFCLIFIFHREVLAEKQKQEKPVLSLQQLIDMAVAKSPEIDESRSKIDMAKSNLKQVKAAYYPQIDITGVTGPVNDSEEPIIINNKIHDPSPGTSLSNTGIFGRLDFTVKQPIYTFGKLFNREEAAKSGIKAREFDIVKKKAEIVLRVKQLYYGLVLARQGLNAAIDAENFFDDARRRIIRLLKLDAENVVESDLYRVDAFRAGSIRSRAEAEKGVKLAYFALKALTNLPPEAEFDIVEDALATNGKNLTELTNYIQKAFSGRPEFKQLEEALNAQEFQVKAVQSDRYPSFFLALEGSLAGAPGRDKLDNPYINDEFNHAYAGILAGLKWNFDFGIGCARVDMAQAEYRKLLYTRDSAKRNISIHVAKCYQEVLEWKKAVNAYRKAAAAARKWLIAAIADFDMGIGTAQDMLNAIEKYGENKGRYLEAALNYNISQAELIYATGVKDWQVCEKK